MTSYFFVVPALPPLVLGEKPEMDIQELRAFVSWDKEGLRQIDVLGRYIDILNIRSLLMEEPLHSMGNLSEKELDEALLIRNVLPEYVFDVLDQYEGVAAKVRHFSQLVVRFFQEESARHKGFLHKYLEFERRWRLVLLAIRCRDLGRDLIKELEYEDPHDPFVAYLLAGKDMERFVFPPEFLSLQRELTSCGFDPWEQYKAIGKWRFQTIGDLAEGRVFSIDAVLAYGAQLMIAKEWYELDEKQGALLLHTLIEGNSS